MKVKKSLFLIINYRKKRFFGLTAMMLLFAANAMAQRPDFSGTWYIANDASYSSGSANNYYLVPAKDPKQEHFADAYFHNQYSNTSGSGDYTGNNYGDPEKPFLTTHKNDAAAEPENLIWRFEPTGDGYYYIIHALTEKYLVYEYPYQNATNRKSVHLQTISSPDANAKFDITGSSSGINIRPISLTGNNTNRFLNPATNNTDYYYGTKPSSGDNYFHVGMIGVWKDATGNSIWHYEEGTVVKPVITPITASKKVNIRALQTGVTVYYTLDGTTPDNTSSSLVYPGGEVNIGNCRKTVKAVAYKNGTYTSEVTLEVDFRDIQQITALSQITDSDGRYQLAADIEDASGHTTVANLTGEFDGNFHTINGLTQPIFGTVDNGIVCNVVLKDVDIANHSGNTGAIACEINGGTIVYNCGILSGSVGGTGDTGGLVGLLNTTSANDIPAGFKPTRVINCYSFADITAAGTYAAGIVGNNIYGSNSQLSVGIYNKLRTAVINCMFYGDVLAGTKKAPVYGNKRIDNDGNGINNYDYFLETATLDDNFSRLEDYNCSWPVEERFLTRFEYFRSILNSNRRLCTWWITQKQYDDQTDDDLNLMAKWVLDPSIAKYPILKPWDKYPSVINQDPNQVWDEDTQTWINRQNALPSQGKKLSTLTVTVDAGYHNSHATRSLTLPVLDMDTLHNDFGYAKVQLPYYIEQFGDPTSDNHALRYGGNYTDSIVTGWKVTAVTGGTPGSFVENWESGYNFADRNCTNKDLYSVSHRVFAQGGWYYVPQGVTAITIEAYWGKAVYVRNTTHNIDRVGLGGNSFAPAGTFPTKFNGRTVYTSIKNAINALSLEGSGATAKTVYDQAIVLVGNLQFKNGGTINNMGWSNGNGNEDFATQNRPFTLTTVDLDFDNEPDYCFEWQFSKGTERLNLHPIRFDFLPVPTLGMAIRSDNNQDEMAIGVFAPRGHFEITETSFMHTGQFEYDARNNYRKEEAPLILNGGQFEQFVSSHNWNGSLGPINRTKYIIVGGNVWMKEFTPGKHGNISAATRHCAVSVMGGDFERFCLSGVFISNNQISNDPDNPHCYTNGGRFGTMSGAGMENIDGDVTFKIDHSVIGEFFGGGLNAARPVSGSIDVTINNSVVGKYCGGPKTGDMEDGTSVTTMANNTVFGEFYGGGDGGTNFNRNRLWDFAQATLADISDDNWKTLGGFNDFTPLQFVSLEAGYQAQFEFELIDISSGLAASNECAVMRTYRHEAQFTATEVRTVASTLNNCTVLQDFYGGGNLGKVTGNVTSTLNGTTIMGSAYGGGNSSDIPMFSIHDKSTVVFPTRDLAGVNHPGSLDYVRDDGEIRYYHWIHDLDDISVTPTPTHNNPAFQVDGQWYCYTDKDMTDLGSVGGNTILNINGATKIYGTREVLSSGSSETFYDGAAFGGGNESKVFGNSTVTVDGTEGLLVSNVYGGGNIATTGRPNSGGNSLVEIYNGIIGVVNPVTGFHYDNSGSVYGGGKGVLEDKDQGRVFGNSVVLIHGGQVLNNVYGGGQIASVGYVNELGEMVNGSATVTINGGEVGPLDMTGHNAYVYGGGQGIETDPNNDYKDFANVNHTLVTVNGGTILGSIFGGGADGHVWGDAEVHFTGGTIGTNAVTSWDGNIFGGGRNFKHTNKTAGRVGGNISISMTGGTMKGNIYGGGRLGNTGVDIDGNLQEDAGNNTYGHITVDVSGGTIGYDYENGTYDPVRYIDTIGNVYGGGKGITFEPHKVNGIVVDTTYLSNWSDFAVVKTTDVRLRGNAYLWGNVYGGSEQSLVRDSVNVVIMDNATVRLRAFAGGRGFLIRDDSRFRNSGDVGEIATETTEKHGLARIILKDNAKVQVCMYGGAKIANVQGNAYVTLEGGFIGRRRPLQEYIDNPHHCYVFGSGKGKSANGAFNTWTNVDTAFVSIKPGTRVYGSVFGGGEDGHVLEDIFLDIELGATDSIGTYGYSKVDGNIFSGGRGFNPQALTAGGTRGNIYTHIHGGGHILGSVFGGGRIASTGIELVADEHAGDTIPDIFDDPETPENEARRFGYIDILIEDDVVIGHDYHQEEVNGVMQSFKIGDVGGNVYGGAMGDDVAPTTVAGQMGHVKQTEILIKDNVWVMGTVNGGGESGHVWKDTKVTIEGNATIGVDRVGEGHQPVDSLVYSGNVFGGSWGSDSLLWVNEGRVYGNCTVLIKGGHIRNNIYGGGEYASIGTYETLTDIHGQDSIVPRGGHCSVIMDGGELGPLDGSGLNAYVFGGGKGVGGDVDNEYKNFGQVYTTYVQILDNARVWGSIFGGGEDGHVTDTVQVDISGGTIGTTGLTTWDGNIFGGGRNYSAANLAAGRVGGNIKVNITGGHMYGSVFGGGRLASVGVDEDGNTFLNDPEAHGHTYININGGIIGYPAEGQCGDDNIRGNVYGGCKGIVRKPNAWSVEPKLIANVITTHVLIQDGATIKGSVFGGAEDGHVLSNTEVTIEGGNIGDNETTCTNRHHGNVFGGGRGIGLNENNQYSNTAGTVNGNTLVTITGGHVNRNVYGGGFLASVGLRGEDFGDPDPNTGWARVKISGGIIGTDDNADIEHGNVFGSCRGVAGAEYQNYAYVNNALVTLSAGDEVVKGSVFGSGEDGHVLINTQVTINGGNVGVEGVENPYKGNVYGGGRGIDLDGNGNLSPTAGLVKGNTKVSVQAGTVFGDVFGGGNASSVRGEKLVDVLNSSSPGAVPTLIHGNVFGGCKAVPTAVAIAGNNKGLKTVNVRGGHIMGNVYGCSFSSIDGDPTSGHENDWTSFINIDGGIIDGNVHAAGWSSEVKGSVSLNIGANSIAHEVENPETHEMEIQPRIAENVSFNDNGGVPIVVFGHVRDINTGDGKATFTGFLVDEGAPVPTRERGFCWSTSHNPTTNDSKVSESFNIGDVGNYSMEVSSGLVTNTTYYVRAYAKNGRGTSYSPEVQFTMVANGSSVLVDGSQQENDCPAYLPTISKLYIKGSVFGGSNYYGNDIQHDRWNLFDITGYSLMFIDGAGYDTQTDNEDGATYMNIGGGVFGSGTHCESGASGRKILIREYGHRNTNGDGSLNTATRSFTTIQRGSIVLLDHVNVNLPGTPDISNMANKNYAILKVDQGLFVSNGSGIVLGATDAPAYMDSIRQVKSLYLKDGLISYEQMNASHNANWEVIGIQGNDNTLYRLHDNNTQTALSAPQENVIIFNDDSRLWVRYHEKKEGDVQVKQYYGELNGFFRMRSPFNPYGTESFAYARPKLTEKNNPIVSAGTNKNKGDGGFLSYENNNNFFTQQGLTVINYTYPAEGDDGGETFTKTKQYPYFNVSELAKKGDELDMVQYREWVLPKLLGKQWYVDGRGIGTGGWGKDESHQSGWGHFPDKPKLTVSGSNGICYDETTGQYNVFDKETDIIYVVGPISAVLENPGNLNRWPDYTLRLFRYPGGHQMSNTLTDLTTASSPSTSPTEPYNGLGTGVTAGPGANLGAMVNVNNVNNSEQDNNILVMENVFVDGLYHYGTQDAGFYTIPTSFKTEQELVSEPLVVTQAKSKLIMKGGTILERGYNNTEGSVWYTNSGYAPVANVHHGGAVYVDPAATVNVEGLVTITDNLQNNNGTAIESNVYLPSFEKSLNISNTLSEGTLIGITSPIKNDQSNYVYNTFSPVAVAPNSTIANSAWTNNNFYDDLNWFFYKEGPNHATRSSYYSTSIADHPGYIFESGADRIPVSTDKTLFFGWTWANVVRKAPDNFAFNAIDSARSLAWLISLVNGLNDQQPASSLSSETILQTEDIDLQQYVWVPVGAEKSTAAAFSGTFDGQGHLIQNLDIDYIGEGDVRYEYTDYGLFGKAVNPTINRTFVVSGLIRPEGTANIGGLVGKLQGQTALVSNSEAALRIVCPNSASETTGAGGLVGKMSGGDIHSSMAMPDITSTNSNVIGGLVGITEDYVYGDNSKKTPTVRNSFTNAKFNVGSGTTYGAGGIVGFSNNVIMDNNYSHVYDEATLTTTNFGLLVAQSAMATVSNCYGFESDFSYYRPGSAATLTNCAKYTPTMSANYLGYMYYDNTVTIGEQKIALFKWLNDWVKKNNSSNIYSYWSRPTLGEINNDLPVLHLCNGTTGLEGDGDFRSLGTYSGGPALQYGGPVRDLNELDAALARPLVKDENNQDIDDYLFVYGDVNSVGTDLSISQSKVSIYEHAAILSPGVLKNFDNTYVGISFDNSHENGMGSSSIGVNFGLVGIGPYPLPRDWHMFSSPLSNAPLGFDYTVGGVNTNEAEYTGGDQGDYFNNVWVDKEMEFNWLNNGQSGNNRYWMKTFAANDQTTDGYFPTELNQSVIPLSDDLFIVNSDETPSDECPSSGVYRYPYGMDFYTWTEPDYHWINFKRNGPNHWHSDENEITGHHDHIDYKPVRGVDSNVNEDMLIVGRGYMAAICDTTFMQSHGRLNGGDDLNIAVTVDGRHLKGLNLLGNPYHAYLDFSQFAANTTNASVLSKAEENPFYVVYDADRYADYPESAFKYYPATGSQGGAYAGQFLHPHQGFYVIAMDTKKIEFTESMTVTRTSLQEGSDFDGHFRDRNTPAYPLVNLFLSSEKGCADVTVIEFERPQWGGARKMKELRVGDGLFYAQHNNIHYAALFAKEGTGRVPLWFEAKEDDVFTISWNTANGNFHSMFLVDNLTGIRYDMIENESYTFQGHLGDYPSRFYITFDVTDIEENEGNHFVFFDGSQWIVTGEGVLDFIDLQGRVLWHSRLSGGQSRVCLPKVACGMYLMRLTGVEGTKVQKIIVN